MVCCKMKDNKVFMQKFLMTDAFADFLLMEARVDTFVRFDIDGHVRKDFYAKEEREGQEMEEYASWDSIRPQVVALIKGKRTPLFMKLTLAYAPERARECLAEEGLTEKGSLVSFLLCTVKYEEGAVTLTGGVSYRGFTMDKTAEKCWDRALCALAEKMGLEYEILY